MLSDRYALPAMVTRYLKTTPQYKRYRAIRGIIARDWCSWHGGNCPAACQATLVEIIEQSLEAPELCAWLTTNLRRRRSAETGSGPRSGGLKRIGEE
jgi:hypothetical protein